MVSTGVKAISSSDDLLILFSTPKFKTYELTHISYSGNTSLILQKKTQKKIKIFVHLAVELHYYMGLIIIQGVLEHAQMSAASHACTNYHLGTCFHWYIL